MNSDVVINVSREIIDKEIVHGESRDANLFAIYAEPQLIFYKDTKFLRQTVLYVNYSLRIAHFAQKCE